MKGFDVHIAKEQINLCKMLIDGYGKLFKHSPILQI